jgi:hypothetical protein
MTTTKFDQNFWEQLWSKTLREHGDKVASRPPNAHLIAEAAPELPRLLQIRCRSQSRARLQHSIPRRESSSSQRSARGPLPAPVSMQ